MEQKSSKHEQQTDFSAPRSCMESLPDELLLMITGYLSSPHLVQAFYGLNHRFDFVVYELVRHFIILKDFTEIKFSEFNSHIQNAIEKICLDVQILPQIIPSINFYSNLSSIVLSCSHIVTVDLNVKGYSPQSIIRSCLNVLRICSIFSVDWAYFDDCSRLDASLACTAIVRLCIKSCSEQALISVCALAPNLTFLKIKQLVSSENSTKMNSILDSIFALMSQISPFLKQLHITATANRLNDLYFVARLISCYQSSLEQLTLEISLNYRPNKYYLQTIFEPCRHLQKLAFVFNYQCDENEEIETLDQFQTNWWLSPCRPPVLIFCNNHQEIFIMSMPCSLDDYIWFPIDPKSWLINKGQLDSSVIRFSKQKSIRFANTHHQLITLDLVYLISHVFQAPKQELSIPNGNFDSPDLLIEQLINTTGQKPLLPMIHSLDLSSCDINELDIKTLIIWLLLAPNAKVLNICQESTKAKIQLINRLQVLIEEDKRLKSVTDSIEEVHVFYMFDSVNYATKQHICQMYSNIFRNPIIRR